MLGRKVVGASLKVLCLRMTVVPPLLDIIRLYSCLLFNLKPDDPNYLCEFHFRFYMNLNKKIDLWTLNSDMKPYFIMVDTCCLDLVSSNDAINASVYLLTYLLTYRDFIMRRKKMLWNLILREGSALSKNSSCRRAMPSGVERMTFKLVARRLLRRELLPMFTPASTLHSHATSFGFKQVNEEEKNIHPVGNVFTNDIINDMMSGGLHSMWKGRLVSKLSPMKIFDVAGGTGGQKRSMFIQTQSTPNPLSLMFYPGKPVMEVGSADFPNPRTAMNSPLAKALYGIDGVTRVFFGSDFITVTKSEDTSWDFLKPEIFAVVMDFYSSGNPLFLDSKTAASMDTAIHEDDSEIVAMIKELLETRIRPAVQDDGGDIEYIGFDPETGVVKLKMQGACSGCPSSSVTLKSGIENMLMHYVPEVKSVEQELDLEEDNGELTGHLE
ncbi:hypothetical protein L2E82_27149 [Cichorium intybus]|uniref:Uncharacterized protein n=1 Tax=Cichorium intybus TaxID=13427 RepID=A0ACB9CS61_CICIN|nr:hypothetical protein L2E82_27149 [Cichorium intybus]